MTKKLTQKQICRIMVKENEKQHEEASGLLKKIISEHSCDMGLIIDAKPEPAPNYNPNMPKQDIYRELARIIYRGVLFTPSALNPDYLKTILPLYDALMPLINEKGAKQIANQFRGIVVERLNTFERLRALHKKRHSY